jgi:cytochrome c5
MKKILTGIGTAFMAAFILAVAWPTAAGSNGALQTEGSGPSGADGKAIFLDQKCNMCHDVSSAGITATTKSEKMKGPDLKGIKQDGEWLSKFLMKEVDLNGQKHKKAFTGNQAELKTLVDWLKEQK